MRNGVANGTHKGSPKGHPSGTSRARSRPHPAHQGVHRMPTGIAGFDQLLDGGLPRDRITLLVGGPGCGKTLFALETLVNGVRSYGEAGIFVAFEERTDQVIADATPMGWSLAGLRADRKLFFLDAHLGESVVVGGEFDLVGLLAALEVKVRELGAKRIVFDGIDVLLGVLDSPAAERREIFRLGDWLRRQRMSGLVTCKTSRGGGVSSQDDAYLSYLADCVITLEQQPSASVLVRRLRVAKCRGIGHSGSDVPFTITGTGLKVASYPNVDLTSRAFSVRQSTGVARLDTMLSGGYYRGSSTLISGSPGTAKSTLSACFADHAARQGEQTLYVSFDEPAAEVVRNMRSIGLDLEPLIRAGSLQIVPTRKGDRSPEEHVSWIGGLLQNGKVRNLVIDPISALASAGGREVGEEAVVRLISICKSLGISLVMTSLLATADSASEETASAVSTIADTWIHLSYLVLAGERNRALTVIKARGTHHSNQVRELVLSDAGVDLTDVYLAGGEVLMGTMRWQKEAQEQGRRLENTQQRARSRAEAELAAAEARARLALLQHEVAAREAQIEALGTEDTRVRDAFDASQTELRRLRTADASAVKRAGARSAGEEDRK